MHSSARDAKRQGELAELVFAERAVRRGLQVSKPYGETAAYDFLVDCEGRISRVQVRSVGVAKNGVYRVSTGNGHSSKRAYTAREIDVLAAYVIPEDVWYLIPVRAFSPAKSVHLCPGRASRRKFEVWRERWDVLERGEQLMTDPSDRAAPSGRRRRR
ncbi:MAG: group I intron-associated PD-(D/E)XK endonuclease [Terriglobales bacterium]